MGSITDIRGYGMKMKTRLVQFVISSSTRGWETREMGRFWEKVYKPVELCLSFSSSYFIQLFPSNILIYEVNMRTTFFTVLTIISGALFTSALPVALPNVVEIRDPYNSFSSFNTPSNVGPGGNAVSGDTNSANGGAAANNAPIVSNSAGSSKSLLLLSSLQRG